MNFPDNLKYSKDHEWLRLEGDTAIVGITEYAQSELGDVVYVEVTEKDKPLSAGDVFGTVEAVKTVSDLNLPVAGTVTEINPELADHPELVNKDPYDKGWIARMKVTRPADVDQMMDSDAYSKFTA